ncbi:MAG: hypothetical protein HW380_2707 [Magnetococcales bacterium]|nr:hypothetical protein [Magnetococcales bacterium]
MPGGGLSPYALTLLLVKIFAGVRPKGGLGAQPQGFDFVSLPEGHHVQKSMLAHMGDYPHPRRGSGQHPKVLVLARRV